MTYHQLDDYLRAKNNYENVRAKIVDGKGYYLVGENWIPDKEYLAHNTKPTFNYPYPDNPDKTHVQ